MKFTILGASGFIGRNLVSYLQTQGHDVNAPARDTQSLEGQNLGHVIYTIGLTGNFRQHPEAATEAHVHVLKRLMHNAKFDSWLYLSSTRIYQNLPENMQADENAPVTTKSGLDGLYDRSKREGEEICLAINNPSVRVARLSNVYGLGQSSHTFLGNILQELKDKGRVIIQEAPDSAKDYIAVSDVVQYLTQIAVKGKERVYNVASGINTTHADLAKTLVKEGFEVDFKALGPRRAFPPVHTGRIMKEFAMKLRSVLQDLPDLIKNG